MDEPAMDESWWDERYRVKPAIWSGEPNPVLVAEVESLGAGRALEVGAGEGADAIWLARAGWSVTGVDISQVALTRARAAADAAGEQVAERTDWVHADLLEWSPVPEAFDLVTVHYLHLPPEQRRDVYRRLSTGVAPGGTLLVVAHHPSDTATTAGRPPRAELFFTAEELIRDLDDGWEVVAGDARPRTATDPEGRRITVHDTVLVARRS